MNRLIKIKDAIEVGGAISDIVFCENSIHSILPHWGCRSIPETYVITIGYTFFDNKECNMAQSFIIGKKDYRYIINKFYLTAEGEF